MKNKLYLFLAKYIFSFLIRLLKSTIRFKLIGRNLPGEMTNKNEGCVLVFWHGQIMIPLMYHTNKNINVLVSQNIDGEIIARIIETLGYISVRGSSSRGGIKVLSEMINLLKESKVVAITPDGPRGPYRKMKMGAISLAQKSGCPIIPISVDAKNKKIFNSWDKFIFVKPFTECIISYGEPIYIKKDLSKEKLKKTAEEVEKYILAQNKQIEKYFLKEKLNKINSEKIYFNKFISTILLPFSWIYKNILSAREFFYKKNILKSASLSKSVISVGNLTLGGTGKTPLTMWIAGILKNNGFKPAILTRGYKGKNKDTKIIDNDSRTIIDAEKTGDEPMLMAKKLQNIPVIIGKNRYESGIIAEKKFNTDVFLLDDGFQHTALKRDLDILLINAVNPFGNGKIFPAGYLRESPTAVKRADAVVITKTDHPSEETIAEIKKYTKAPLFFMKYSALSLRSIDENSLILPEEFSSLQSVVFSGIFDHQYFIKTIVESGITILDYIKFPDHHNYKKRDLRKIISAFNSSKADIIITTGKDAVKITTAHWKPYPFYYIDINVEIKNSEKLEEIIINTAKEKATL